MDGNELEIERVLPTCIHVCERFTLVTASLPSGLVVPIPTLLDALTKSALAPLDEATLNIWFVEPAVPWIESLVSGDDVPIPMSAPLVIVSASVPPPDAAV